MAVPHGWQLLAWAERVDKSGYLFLSANTSCQWAWLQDTLPLPWGWRRLLLARIGPFLRETF